MVCVIGTDEDVVCPLALCSMPTCDGFETCAPRSLLASAMRGAMEQHSSNRLLPVRELLRLTGQADE